MPQVHYNGVHSELAYNILEGCGFDSETLASLHIHMPLISLSSTDTVEFLLDYLCQDEQGEQVFNILNEYKIVGMLYLLQQFCRGCESDNVLWDIPTLEQTQIAFESAIASVNKDFQGTKCSLYYK